jgi:hypothetical protein
VDFSSTFRDFLRPGIFTAMLPGPLIYCVFCSFGRFLDCYFGGEFKGEFCPFFGLLKSAFSRFQIGCMTHFKTAHGQVPIADSPLYRIPFRIFNCLFIRVFRSPFSGISPVMDFRPLLAKRLFYWVFCNLWAFWNPDFEVDFHPPFSEQLTSWHLWVIGGLLELDPGFIAKANENGPQLTRYSPCSPRIK